MIIIKNHRMEKKNRPCIYTGEPPQRPPKTALDRRKKKQRAQPTAPPSLCFPLFPSKPNCYSKRFDPGVQSGLEQKVAVVGVSLFSLSKKKVLRRLSELLGDDVTALRGVDTVQELSDLFYFTARRETSAFDC
jgi:hypothetical protein